MPFVEVHMISGRNDDQKRALVRAITDALVTYANASPDHLHVVINEYSKDNWAIAGGLLSDS
jgi:4-oxalocrotonate tautomerase